MTLYIGHAQDHPHAAHDGAWTRCGYPLGKLRKITDKQALVYLGDRRCPACFPLWSQQKGQHHG